ncbi:hypothetical protein Tco_0476666, partial [Tanacetum coccineum]
KPRTLDTLCNANTEYFPYVPAFDRLPTNIHALPEDSLIPNSEDVLDLDEAVHPESADVSESTELQEDDKDEP